MSNFTKVGDGYVLSNLNVNINSNNCLLMVNNGNIRSLPMIPLNPSNYNDKIAHFNTNGNLSTLPICRDYLTAFHKDNYPEDSILTFGSMIEYGKLVGKHSYFGLYPDNWYASTEWTNIGNTELTNNFVVDRDSYTMTVKYDVEALLTFNGLVESESDDIAYVWYRVKDDVSGKVLMQGTTPIPKKGYQISFSMSRPESVKKGAKLKFEISCNNGGKVKVIGNSTLAYMTVLTCYKLI